MLRLAIPSCLLFCGLATSISVNAATREEWNFQNTATSCQLATSSTNTQARGKTTGFRNESTTKNAIVLCGYNVPTVDSWPTSLSIEVATIDGVARTVNCTAATGISGLYDFIYSSKSVSSNVDNNGYGWLGWFPSDFGSTNDFIPGGYSPSVTCVLPPQTAISMLWDTYYLEIGG